MHKAVIELLCGTCQGYDHYRLALLWRVICQACIEFARIEAFLSFSQALTTTTQVVHLIKYLVSVVVRDSIIGVYDYIVVVKIYPLPYHRLHHFFPLYWDAVAIHLRHPLKEYAVRAAIYIVNDILYAERKVCLVWYT